MDPPPKETPWAVRVVKDKQPPKKKRDRPADGQIKAVVPRHQPKPVPWAPPSPPSSPEPERSREQPRPPRPRKTPKKYVATEAVDGRFGIIDPLEPGAPGEKVVLAHVPRRIKAPWEVLAQIRPGETLTVRATPKGQPASLRVRFTTPARYHSPGQKVCTLRLGVDEADWRALTRTPSDI